MHFSSLFAISQSSIFKFGLFLKYLSKIRTVPFHKSDLFGMKAVIYVFLINVIFSWELWHYFPLADRVTFHDRLSPLDFLVLVIIVLFEQLCRSFILFCPFLEDWIQLGVSFGVSIFLEGWLNVSFPLVPCHVGNVVIHAVQSTDSLFLLHRTLLFVENLGRSKEVRFEKWSMVVFDRTHGLFLLSKRLVSKWFLDAFQINLHAWVVFCFPEKVFIAVLAWLLYIIVEVVGLPNGLPYFVKNLIIRAYLLQTFASRFASQGLHWRFCSESQNVWTSYHAHNKKH